MAQAQAPTRRRKVWATVVDPNSGRGVINDWDNSRPSEWVVPTPVREGDLVLAWISDGSGFRYLLQATTQPRHVSADAQMQVWLFCVMPITPALTMPELQDNEALRQWWPVVANMQGVVERQKTAFSDEAEWPWLLKLIATRSPAAAELISSRLTESQGAKPPQVVKVVDEGVRESVDITVTYDLGTLLARSAAINDERDSFDLSFSSLMLATLYSRDHTLGRWLADHFRRQRLSHNHLLTKVRTTTAEATAKAAEGLRERTALLSNPLRRTESARRAMDEASAIASAQGETLDVPHLVFALIGINNYHVEDFNALGLNRATCAAAFLQHMALQRPDQIEHWKRHYQQRFEGSPLPALDLIARPGHRPDYDADAYTSHDLLSIDDEVEALAYVIAAKQTTPPLAIGLFGEWGSGKTFFMKHLRRQIDLLAAEARSQKPGERAVHARIAQIEFNAWHYQEGDLWASLVDHILRNLRFGEDEEETKVTERRQLVVRELEDTQTRQEAAAQRADAADQKVKAAEQTVSEKQNEEDDKRKALAEALVSKPALQAIRKGTTLDAETVASGRALMQQLQIDVALGTAEELRDALSGARQELASVLAFLVPLFRAQDRLRRALLLLAATVIPVVAAIVLLALMREPGLLAKLSAWTGTAIAAATLVTGWLRSQTVWVKNVREQVSAVAVKVEQEFVAAVEQELTDQKKAVADAMSALDIAVQERTRAQTERDQAAAQAEAIKLRLETLGDEGLMRAFLDERIGGGTYQQKLGTAALVRRDFEALSRKIVNVSTRETDGKLKKDELVINRIVLYIDDLDRCEMDKVVPVLRAVHLLLAFKAFVVVVGVDSRWVARCLQKHHEEIFADVEGDEGRRVTPLDYLEKIFQIPIWLEPVPASARVTMVQKLLRPDPTVEQQEKRGGGGEPADGTATSGAENGGSAPPGEPKDRPSEPAKPLDATDGGATDQEKRTDDDAGRSGSEGTPPPQSEEPAAPPPAAATPRGRPLDLNPRGLDITDGEYSFIANLGPLLSNSPRALKRFVNTYRLINVALAEKELAETDEAPGDAEIRMVLLAVLIGMPEFSFVLQDRLRKDDWPDDARFMDLIEDVWAPDWSLLDESIRTRAQNQWVTVHAWIEERGDPWRSLEGRRVKRWLDPVGRYTFNLTRASASLSTQPIPPTSGSMPGARPKEGAAPLAGVLRQPTP